MSSEERCVECGGLTCHYGGISGGEFCPVCGKGLLCPDCYNMHVRTCQEKDNASPDGDAAR